MKFHRRRFIKFVTFGTATSVVAGKLWQRELLAYCENSPGQSDAVFKLRVSDYPALQFDYGSVRLGINPIISEEEIGGGRFYPIIINRVSTNSFLRAKVFCSSIKVRISGKREK